MNDMTFSRWRLMRYDLRSARLALRFFWTRLRHPRDYTAQMAAWSRWRGMAREPRPTPHYRRAVLDLLREEMED